MIMWIVLAAGAAGSVGLLLHAAGHGVSPILVLVMIAWVVAPSAALAFARRRLTNAFIVAVIMGSLAIYAIDAIRRLNAKTAFVYVVVPMAAWVIIAVRLLIGWKRRSRAPVG